MAYTSDTLASGGTAYFDGSFTTPTEVALPVIEYPFPDDTSTRQITRRYWVRSGNYSASSIATNTTDSVFTLAVLTEERVVGQPGADLYEIERVYNEVPNPRQDYQTYVYAYPGINQTLLTTGSVITLTGVSYCHTTSSLTWSSPTFPNLTDLRLRVSLSTPALNLGYIRYLGAKQEYSIRETITNASGAGISFAFPLNNAQVSGSSVCSTARATTGGASIYRRNPVQELVTSRLDQDFIVVGDGARASFSSPDQIPFAQPFQVVLAWSGEPQDYITTATNPSVREYAAIISENGYLPTSDTTIEQWRGNIYRRSTRYVPAR